MLSEQQQRIMGYFIEEAKDHLNTIEQGLIDLKATIADPEMVTEVFRAAHSVKGGAAMLGLSSIQQTAHRLEDYFKVLKECSGINTDQKLETLFLRVFDTLQELLEQLQGPFGLTEDKAAELMAGVEPVFTELGQHLNHLVSQAGAALPEDVSLARPAVNPLTAVPVSHRSTVNREESALQLIFQSDIPVRLRDMLQLFKQPDNEQSRQQLQDLCQTMAQPGEQLDLPNWCDLLERAWLAISNTENSYRSLAPILIKEIKTAQELVLAGRSPEIVPSQALLDLLPPEPEPTDLDADLVDLFGAIEDQSFLGEETSLDFGAVTSEATALEQPFLLFEDEAAATEDWFTAAETNSATSIQDEDSLVLEDFPLSGIPLDNALDAVDTSEDDFSLLDELENSVVAQPRRTGPEVGRAELNSLADLFDGETPDLGLDWDASETVQPEEAAVVSSATGDFSDLLFEQNGSDDLLLDDGEEDLSGLLDTAQQGSHLDSSDEAAEDGSALFADAADSFDSFNSPDFDVLFDSEASSNEATIASPKATRPIGDLDELFAGLEMEELAPISEERPATESFEDAFDTSALSSLEEPDTAAWDADLWTENKTSSPSSDGASDNPFDDFSAAFNLESAAEPNSELFELSSDASETELSPELFNLGLDDSAAETDGAELFDFATADPEAPEPEIDHFELDPTSLGLASDPEPFDLASIPEFTTESVALPDPAADLNWFEEGPEAPIAAVESASNDVLDLFDVPVQPDDLFETIPAEAGAEWSVTETGGADLDALFGEDAITVEPPDRSEAKPFDLESLGTDTGFEDVFESTAPAEEEWLEASQSVELFQELDTPITANAPSTSEHAAELTLDFGDSDVSSTSSLEFIEMGDAIDQDLEEMESPFSLDASLFGDMDEGTSDVLELNLEEIGSEPFSWNEEDSIALDENDPGSESFDFELEQPITTADTEALNFAEFDTISEPDQDTADTEALNFAEFDAISELDQDSHTDDSTLPSTSELDEFGDLELMLVEEPSAASAITSSEADEFGDLELMLAEEPATAEQTAASSAASGDDFADLEAMLAEEPLPQSAEALVNPTPLSSADDFADLEALLGDMPAPPTSPPLPATNAPPVTRIQESDDEFGDLEALLKDADQTLGVGSSPTRKASSTTNRRSNRRNVLNDQTMRVSVKHLDNLNNLVGEMVVNRNSLEQAQERLRQFLDNLLYQVQQLSDVGQRMRDLYERSLLERSLLASRRNYHASGTASALAETSHATGVSFDALEIDQFTAFHTLSQEMIELIVRVRESASDIDFVVEESDQVTRNFRQITTQLQEGLTRARMVPFSQTADRLPRGVRDNSLKYGKQAELIIEGRDTLIDKMIVEQLYDPMTHLVNNAIAHGIETPEERIAAGKSPTGRITIRTFHQGNQTVISVSDDGAGINADRVKAKAVEKGVITAAEARELSRLDVYDLLFHHGFSTADKVDDLRGRGVGLDVVRNNLNEIRGTITIDSAVGKGTTFTIRLPLTLSISKALCCISNRARIAFPMDGVEDMLDVPKDRIQTNEEGHSCIYWRDMLLPFQPLSDLLRYNRVLGRGSVYGGNQEEDIVSVVVLRSAGTFLALQVDQVLGEQEIVIKQLEGPVPKPLGVAGATVQGDGRIMPIADVLELIDLWEGRIRREPGSSLWDREDPVAEVNVKTDPTVLIVDDSITVRELLSMTFSKIGYRVEQARDGQEAWEKLRAGLPCDLVFCDIEMPRMDGLELLSRIQKDPNLNHLPIAMLTSRGADRHRQMAVQLGAKGYFTKPYLEEGLLDAAQRMLKGEVLVSSNTASGII